jgi:hypothetical protein
MITWVDLTAIGITSTDSFVVVAHLDEEPERKYIYYIEGE